MAWGWNYETGYEAVDDSTVKAFYPQRATFTGPFTSLRIVLRSYVNDMDYLCHGCEQGFRVHLHNPAENSWSSGHVLAVPLNTSVMMLAKPNLIQTSEGLRELSPVRRSCLFSSERPLKFFQMYSQDNCLYECYVNMTVTHCGCATVGTPRILGTPVCISMSSCLMDTYRKECIFLGVLDAGEDAALEKVLNQSLLAMQSGTDYGALPCDCLPSCTILKYDGEASVDTFPSQLNVYFNSLQFVSNRRSELYGHTDFLANFGGLLGLFTGFSVISLVEVGYYVSLRL
ncbi:hypothetical protein FOCC_FOCC008540, partial [Frankliniella occidentalis]